MKSKRSIPILAELVRDMALDRDSRWGAVAALGKVVRKRFDKQPDPIAAAIDWLNSKGH
jgi:hypothetical protein